MNRNCTGGKIYRLGGEVIKKQCWAKWKKQIVLFAGMLLVLCLAGIFLPEGIEAAGRRNVKVAFFPMDGFHIKDGTNNYDGMDVRYLNALCEYADWNIEYVECESWDKALQMLSDKQVDLVGSAQFSEERAKTYQYASLPSGYTFGAIAARETAHSHMKILRP